MRRDYTELFLDRPYWRSYLLPIYTTKQLIFLGVSVSIGTLVGLVAGDFGLMFGLIIVASSIGALSSSAPAILRTSAKNLRRIEAALLAGGWTQDGKDTWTRPRNPWRSWENDSVRTVILNGYLEITGPVFTLRALQALMRRVVTQVP